MKVEFIDYFNKVETYKDIIKVNYTRYAVELYKDNGNKITIYVGGIKELNIE